MSAPSNWYCWFCDMWLIEAGIRKHQYGHKVTILWRCTWSGCSHGYDNWRDLKSHKNSKHKYC